MLNYYLFYVIVSYVKHPDNKKYVSQRSPMLAAGQPECFSRPRSPQGAAHLGKFRLSTKSLKHLRLVCRAPSRRRCAPTGYWHIAGLAHCRAECRPEFLHRHPGWEMVPGREAKLGVGWHDARAAHKILDRSAYGCPSPALWPTPLPWWRRGRRDRHRQRVLPQRFPEQRAGELPRR